MCTDAPTCIVAPDTLQLSAKFQPWNPNQLEATLILSNFGYHPLPNLKCTPDHSCIGYQMHTPSHAGV